MKYDPILCMMVDDSVKMEDASWKAWSLYIDGKFVKAFNSEMPPIKEAKTYMKENYPNKVAKLSRNTGSASGYTISTNDSKAIDEAIRACDSRVSTRNVVTTNIAFEEIKKMTGIIPEKAQQKGDTQWNSIIPE